MRQVKRDRARPARPRDELRGREIGKLVVRLLATLEQAVRNGLEECRHLGQRTTQPDFWGWGVHGKWKIGRMIGMNRSAGDANT